MEAKTGGKHGVFNEDRKRNSILYTNWNFLAIPPEGDSNMNEKKNVLAALVKAQLEIQNPKKDKRNEYQKYSYASIDSIYDSVRIPLANNGLTLVSTVEKRDQGYVLIASLHHISGESLISEFPMIAERESKIPMQALGSSRTYAARYAICNLLGLPSEDDDGESTIGEIPSKKSYSEKTRKSEKISKEDQDDLLSKVASRGMDEILKNILKSYGVSHVSELLQCNLPIIKKQLNDSWNATKEKSMEEVGIA